MVNQECAKLKIWVRYLTEVLRTLSQIPEKELKELRVYLVLLKKSKDIRIGCPFIFRLIHIILNPIVEINNVAVDAWETFLVTFNTPRYNTHQSCSVINVTNKRTTRITLTRVLASGGYWSTTFIQWRLVCMWNTGTDLILIYPETVIRKQTLETLSVVNSKNKRRRWR